MSSDDPKEAASMQTAESTPTLRELRHRRGYSLEAAGYLSDLDVATWSRIERGLVRPSRRTVVALAKALGIAVGRMVEIVDRTMQAAEEAAPE
jgi:transcriptional regulator with XRE-family HTH domain